MFHWNYSLAIFLIFLVSRAFNDPTADSSSYATSPITESTNNAITTTMSSSATDVTTVLGNTNGPSTMSSSSPSASVLTDTTGVSSTTFSSTGNPSTIVGSSSTSGSSSGTSSTITTPFTGVNITQVYQYSIGSNSSLSTGPITDTNTILSVTRMVNASFPNLNSTNITVLQISINNVARAYTYNYYMLVTALFTSASNSCQADCIKRLATAPNVPFTLLDSNNNSVSAYATSAPTLTSDLPTAVNYPRGGPSPGVPAQLGMGLGISLIGVLLIAEIVFLYQKFGFSNTRR